MMDELVVRYITSNYPKEAQSRLQFGSTPLITRPLYLALRNDLPGVQSIIDRFNAQLRVMITDRTYHRLLHVDWINADVDGDGIPELVPRGDRVGIAPPQAAYSITTSTEKTGPSSRPARSRVSTSVAISTPTGQAFPTRTRWRIQSVRIRAVRRRRYSPSGGSGQYRLRFLLAVSKFAHLRAVTVETHDSFCWRSQCEPERSSRLGAPLRAVENRSLHGIPDGAASAGVCRTPVKHRFSNETECPPKTKRRRRRSAPLRARFSGFAVTALRVTPIRLLRSGGCLSAPRSLVEPERCRNEVGWPGTWSETSTLRSGNAAGAISRVVFRSCDPRR